MANSIEGSIVKLKDITESTTGTFSIAKLQVYTNETPTTTIEKYTPAKKLLKGVKEYFSAAGKTYKMMNSMFVQSPCFNNVEDYSYQLVPYNWTDATPANVISNTCTVGTFQPISNGSLRLKIEPSSATYTREFDGNLTAKEVVQQLIEQYRATVYVIENDRKNALTCKLNNHDLSLVDLTYSNLNAYYGVFRDKELVEIKKKNDNKDALYKYVLRREGDKWLATSNSVHYKEVNGMDFSDCESLQDVVDILNTQGFNAVFSIVETASTTKIKVATKSAGTSYKISVVECTSASVVIDLKNVIFQDSTSATSTTISLASNLANIIAVGDGKLALTVGGTLEEKTGLVFTSCTTLADVVNVLNGASFTGVTFSEANNKITITTTAKGSSASVEMTQSTSNKIEFVKKDNGKLKPFEKPIKAPSNAGTDLYGATLLDGANQVITAGSDGYTENVGTEGSGDSITDLYAAYNIYPDFYGSVLTSTGVYSIENLYALNLALQTSASSGNRIVMFMTLNDPYQTEATTRGELTDWLDTKYLGIGCAGFTGNLDLEFRGAVVSMAAGTNVFDQNVVNGAKKELHMKSIVLEDATLSDISFDNEMLDLVNTNGCTACGYFKDGFGWKITIPSGSKQFTFVDTVNLQNIYKTFMMDLTNYIATSNCVNKTEAVMNNLRNIIYNDCYILSNNQVLTGDVSDFSSIATDIDKAKVKASIAGPAHAFVYIPAVTQITGKVISITVYLGYAESIYGFELSNVILK